ncbi:MAG: galactose mutarotase [Lachnospiraceae bacterium]|uniref:Aldose 1-epimerase n=1 Tax=Candidatus Weimeria bifida TaxID=2599074 RepID=A0A6N7J0I0_9FIRM|nr:galactose mutarotase [Candidatus Weimeria bifida]RRF96862.1 MAG: galactose mutarotase [Lachnospiraceae bacterium]
MGQVIGKTEDGKDIIAYEISGGRLHAKVMNFGANLMELHVKMADGEDRDIVLGYKNIEQYFDNDPNYGCLIGPNANRVGGASFKIDGVEYQLDKNEFGHNNLHSAFHSVQRSMWETKEEAADHVTFVYHRPDMEFGFPGNMDIEATYTIDSDSHLILDYKGISDKKTVFNPTNHSYFNLHGEGNGDIQDHEVCIHADYFSETDEESIPHGTDTKVEGTPMDFREFHAISERIDADYDQLKWAGGYDHNYELLKDEKYHRPAFDHDGMKEYEAAQFRLPDKSLQVNVITDRPGVQFYAGNNISGKEYGKSGRLYVRRGGLAFETQFFPNAINVPKYDQPVIEAGKTYHTRTVYEII